MAVLKPRVVEWALESWSMLRKRKEMIVRGWAKIGLDAIFKPERQTAALLHMLTRNINLDDAPDGKEDEPESQAEEWEILAEEEQCDEANAVEEDEEQVNMDVSIAACLESSVIPQGVRRSSRLAARGDVLRDSHMAALLQEQVYVDGCAEE